MKLTLSLFLCLQLADCVTTAAAIRLGGGEANPLLQFLMGAGPVAGLLLAKSFVIAVGLYAAVTGRYQGLRWANVAFVGVVTWNLATIGWLAMGT